jgi:hypothetical protein
MPKKLEPIPPGSYTMVINRVRKVRNKPLRRVHMRIVDGPFQGREVINTIKDPVLSEGEMVHTSILNKEFKRER